MNKISKEEEEKLSKKRLIGEMIQGPEGLDTSSGKWDCPDIFLILCAIICFFRGILSTGGLTGIKDRS